MKNKAAPDYFQTTWMNRRVRKNGTVYFVPPVNTSPVKVFTKEEREALAKSLKRTS